MARTFAARPLFAYRSPPGGGAAQAILPACKAWRIIARRVRDFAPGLQSAIDSKWPPAPAGLLDGVYPVLVRITGEQGDEVQGTSGLVLVDSDGWQAVEMGPNWHIEYVQSPGGLATDQFAYTLETVGDVKEAGQVSTPRQGADVDQLLGPFSSADVFLTPIDVIVSRPPGARAVEAWYKLQSFAGAGAPSDSLVEYDEDGNLYDENLVIGTGLSQGLAFWSRLFAINPYIVATPGAQPAISAVSIFRSGLVPPKLRFRLGAVASPRTYTNFQVLVRWRG